MIRLGLFSIFAFLAATSVLNAQIFEKPKSGLVIDLRTGKETTKESRDASSKAQIQNGGCPEGSVPKSSLNQFDKAYVWDSIRGTDPDPNLDLSDEAEPCLSMPVPKLYLLQTEKQRTSVFAFH